MGTLMIDKNLPSPAQNLENESLQIEIKSLLDTLSERQNLVLKMYFGIDRRHPLSLEDISHYLGLTRERVRQIKERAIRRLRKAYNRNNLKSYLG
mgnify:CR=1 FL=1